MWTLMWMGMDGLEWDGMGWDGIGRAAGKAACHTPQPAEKQSLTAIFDILKQARFYNRYPHILPPARHSSHHSPHFLFPQTLPTASRAYLPLASFTFALTAEPRPLRRSSPSFLYPVAAFRTPD